MTQTSRVRRKAQQAEDAAQDAAPGDDDMPQGGAVKQLRGVASEAAVSVLTPVAKKLATRAAKMAIERGPELLEDEVFPRLQDMGDRLGDMGGKLGERFGGGDEGGGRAGDGTGKGRRMPIQQSVDVAAPLQTVYDQFTQFEEFPKFMHRVERVEQRDPETVVFHEKIWGVRRMWEAEIVEQEPDERIVWKTTSGMNHVGVITFHELSERLTRVELNIDLDPDGLVEKFARGARFAKRAARADLKRFKAFVEMRDEETGAWRGAIEDGDVVDEQDYEDEEEEEQEEPQAREDEDEEEEQDEPEAREDEEDLDEDEDEEDEEESRRASRRTKSNGGRQRSRKQPQAKSRTQSKAKAKPKTQSRSRAKSNGKSSSGSGSRKRTTSRSR